MIHHIPETEKELHKKEMGCQCNPGIHIRDKEIFVIHNPTRAIREGFDLTGQKNSSKEDPTGEKE